MSLLHIKPMRNKMATTERMPYRIIPHRNNSYVVSENESKFLRTGSYCFMGSPAARQALF